ncbi:MAG: BatA domain-containing protein [Saprospiraceae bacterium]
MQFLHPWFLAALGTLAIPIIIHLFYFRRFKKVYFSSVRFLKEVKDETSARSKLKNLLVLIARLLALAFLVMAFAQPFVSKKTKEKFAKTQVGLFVDNSYSMNALSQEVPLVTLAKQRARTVVESYNVEDQFMILTHEFAGKQFRLVPQEEALSLIDEIRPTPAVHTLEDALLKIKYTISKNEGNKHIYLISDFQQSITDLTNVVDSNYNLHLIPLQSVQEKNLSIDSAWFDSPTQFLNRPNLLKYRIRNFGDQPVQDARISLTQNNQSKPIGLVNLTAGESKIDTAQIMLTQPGWQNLQLEVTDYPIQFDDKLFISFQVKDKINILLIANGIADENLQTAIKSLPSVNLAIQQSNNIDYKSLSQFQLIILDDLNNISTGLANELTSNLKQGLNVLVFPGIAADLNSYNNFCTNLGAGTFAAFDKKQSTASYINTNEFIFNDVFLRVTSNMKLPTVQGKYKRVKGAKGEESILAFPDETNLISKIKIDNGSLYLATSPLNSEYSDLSKNAEIFVPMIYRMALNKNQNEKIALFIGNDQNYEISAQKKSPDDVIHLIGTTNDDLIPQQRTLGSKIILDVTGAIQNAGIYSAMLKDSLIAKLPFNFNRKESDLKTFTMDELKLKYPDLDIIQAANSTAFDSYFKSNNKGTTYWKWFVIATLLFLLIESLLLRFWKL